MHGFKCRFVTPSCDKAKIMSSSSASDEDSFSGDEVLSATFEQGNRKPASPQKRDKLGQSEHVRPKRVIKPTKKALECDQNAGKCVSRKLINQYLVRRFGISAYRVGDGAMKLEGFHWSHEA